MHFIIFLIALIALTSAIPHPHPSPTDAPDDEPITISPILPTATTTFPASTSPNIPITSLPSPSTTTSDPDDDECTTSKKNPHREPIPIFSKQCNCALATARYPRRDIHAGRPMHCRAVTLKRTFPTDATCKLQVAVRRRQELYVFSDFFLWIA